MAYKKRDRVEVKEDDPRDHIRGMYFLKIPYEKIIIGFFAFTALVYTVKLFVQAFINHLDLAMFMVSMAIVLLLVYKILMSFTAVAEFQWSSVGMLVLNGVISFFIYQQMTGVIELFQEAREYTLTVHLLGMVLGLGGTTVIDIMIFHFLRNFKINNQEAVIMHLISQIIIIGLILLIVSGVALFLTDIEGYLSNDRFMMKMTVMVVVILNGGVLNLYITPALEEISLLKKDLQKNNTLKKTSFAVGAISMLSWYSAFFFAMIKDLSYFSYVALLIPYLLFLGLAIGISQFAKKQMEKKVLNQS
ncbi:hypothetical protein KIH41_10885 [Litoribacter ruber]|uniref:Uncharacterized protein n=1 Tax=Litoribacter ruber TaxID=702568 RepID=A0AAP2CJU7_9BACT|nr:MULTISPECIES: hypothetical protein [Litoribacter]MBS9525084.1 hypothetical protein [Litoribacter alkaliphilus]MBT0811781.1 hypothetical protein [Litoribacter ruber]